MCQRGPLGLLLLTALVLGALVAFSGASSVDEARDIAANPTYAPASETGTTTQNVSTTPVDRERASEQQHTTDSLVLLVSSQREGERGERGERQREVAAETDREKREKERHTHTASERR